MDHSVRIFNVTVSARLLELLSRNTTLKLLSPIFNASDTAWMKLRPQCGGLYTDAVVKLTTALRSCTRNEVSLGFCWMTEQLVSNQQNTKQTAKIINKTENMICDVFC